MSLTAEQWQKVGHAVAVMVDLDAQAGDDAAVDAWWDVLEGLQKVAGVSLSGVVADQLGLPVLSASLRGPKQ